MTHMRTPFALIFAALLAACGGSDDDDSGPVTMACVDFSGKTIAGAAVASASVVAATAAAPEYCRVQATIPSKLRFELRLPTTGWNGKLLYGGGGGFNGSIPPANAAALSAGYANVTSDSGHVGSSDVDASWALNDTEALNNYANLSVPRVTLAAREMVRQRYGSEAERAYFEGCSNGGREALMAAQRNPELFDGIIARAPAYNITSLLLHFQRSAKLLAAPGGAFTSGKVATLSNAVLAACDALDGSTDGLIAITGSNGSGVGRLLAAGQTPAAEHLLDRLQRLFADRLYLELQRHGEDLERRIEGPLIELAYARNLPLVATNDVHFPKKSMYEAHDVLLCIEQGAHIDDPNRRRLTPEHYFKSAAEMRSLFSDIPEACDNTLVIARRCAYMPAPRKPKMSRCVFTRCCRHRPRFQPRPSCLGPKRSRPNRVGASRSRFTTPCSSVAHRRSCLTRPKTASSTSPGPYWATPQAVFPRPKCLKCHS